MSDLRLRPTQWFPDRAAQYRSSESWKDLTLADVMMAWDVNPGRIALVEGDSRLTNQELTGAVMSLATFLRDRGLGAGDVISFQLPNWWETAVVALAAAKIGAVVNPLQMIYRQGELRFILAQARTSALFVPGIYRGTDYTAMTSEVADSLEWGLPVISVRSDGDLELAQILESTAHETAFEPAHPDDVCLLMYTSGTTAEPKGVLHTHNTLVSATDDLIDLFELAGDDVMFMPSPLTHITGLLLGLLVPLRLGAVSVLMSEWDPEKALLQIVETQSTFTGGATPFLRGYIEVARQRRIPPADIPLVKGPCGGADVPPSVIYEAAEHLGARFTRIYGATEGVTVSGTQQSEALRRAAETDGAPLPGHEIRLTSDNGVATPTGSMGEVLTRGPSNFVGYLDSTLNQATFTEGGWIRMGDYARFDASGYLEILGRKKDIIIRKGENISAKEVEDLLSTHPALDEVAVVGIPDPSTGERACACVVIRNGFSVSLSDLCAVLERAQVAKQKYPERLEEMEMLPKTASGKIQKFKLRQIVIARTEGSLGGD